MIYVRSLTRAVSTTQALDFTYDSSGLRTSKTVDGVTHKYLYAGGKLMRETYGSNTLDFFYDANGTPYALKYNGTVYYYITNLQSDVIQIVDASGNAVATYEYDPYGKVISATGTLAETNPIRYRGYYYDTETGLYYLQSRYYDPDLGRWINADDTEYWGADGTLISYNLFAYCKNNPVMGYDPTGHFSWADVFNTAAVVTIAALVVIAIVGSGGSAAPPLLALAGTLAGTTVSASAATSVATSIAITGIAVMGAAATADVLESSPKNRNGNSSQNNQYSGGSTYNKSGERIDYEYNGNGSGNVHYQGSKGKHMLWTLKDGIETTHTVTKSVGALISTPQVQRAISKAISIVCSLAGR